MIDQTFSTQNLLKLVHRLDPSRYRLGRKPDDYLARMALVSQDITADDFQFSFFDKALRGGKPVYTASTCQDEFAIRKLNDNIRRLYNVSQSNRHEIIAQVKLLLQEKLPFYVIRLDVKDFYESIRRSTLIDRLCSRSLLGYRSKKLLSSLFASTPFSQNPGLPRGISLSATLSEIYMRDFDTTVRRTPGVYYYARYVDDIIIFSITEPNSLLAKITNSLPAGMGFNSIKKEIIEFNENGNCISFINHPSISYLGYQFHFRQQSEVFVGNRPQGTPPDPPRLIVRIAESKIKKMKQRIMLSLLDFVRDPNFPLLFSRIRFLTSNTQMHRHKSDGTLLSGIYYSYSYIDEAGVTELRKLTLFMRNAIFSQNCSFGRKLSQHLTKSQRKLLGKFSFEAGHTKRITHSVSASRLRQIKKCWQHV